MYCWLTLSLTNRYAIVSFVHNNHIRCVFATILCTTNESTRFDSLPVGNKFRWNGGDRVCRRLCIPCGRSGFKCVWWWPWWILCLRQAIVEQVSRHVASNVRTGDGSDWPPDTMCRSEYDVMGRCFSVRTVVCHLTPAASIDPNWHATSSFLLQQSTTWWHNNVFHRTVAHSFIRRVVFPDGLGANLWDPRCPALALRSCAQVSDSVSMTLRPGTIIRSLQMDKYVSVEAKDSMPRDDIFVWRTDQCVHLSG